MGTCEIQCDEAPSIGIRWMLECGGELPGTATDRSAYPPGLGQRSVARIDRVGRFVAPRPPSRERRDTAIGQHRHALPVSIVAQQPAFLGGFANGSQIALRQWLRKRLPVDALAFERRITERPVERMIGNQAIDAQSDVMRITGPAIGFRRVTQTCANRVQFNVAATYQQIAFGLDNGRTIASFPQ